MRRILTFVVIGLLLLSTLAASSVASAVPATPTATAAPDRPVPRGFRAQSTSWISPDRGWVLGSVPCQRRTCSLVVETADGGESWNAVGSPPAHIIEAGKPGISQISFADELHGWVFGPSLYETDDGGRSWVHADLPGDGIRVITFDATGGDGSAYVVVSPCRFGIPISQCHRSSELWRTPVGQDIWTQVPVDLGVAYTAVLALEGPVAYVVGQLAPVVSDAFFATTDGVQWEPRPSPCRNDRDEVLTDVAPITGERVALLCIGDPGFSKSVKRVFRSIDSARTTTSAGTAPLDGITSALAAAPGGTLVIATYSSGSWLYRNDGGQDWATALAEADGGQGWNDITFTTANDGFIVHAPVGPFDRIGELLATHDAGLTWSPVNIR